MRNVPSAVLKISEVVNAHLEEMFQELGELGWSDEGFYSREWEKLVIDYLSSKDLATEYILYLEEGSNYLTPDITGLFRPVHHCDC